MSKKCACGNPAHPLYSGRCEDCWVANQRGGHCTDPHFVGGNILKDYGVNTYLPPHLEVTSDDHRVHQKPKGEDDE